VSLTRFTTTEPNQPPELWQHITVPAPLADTPAFYQHLINTPPTEQDCQAIANELQGKTLIACSDGACDTSSAVSSYGTVFASNLLQQQLSSVVGPVDGHPVLLTSYRAELSGIIATLYLVYRLCQYYQITEGAMTLYCDNKGAPNNAFKGIKPGITPYFNTDHDLIDLAQALLTLIPIVVSTSWVKGHYTGKARLYQHDLNDTADRIAGEYQKQQTPHFTIRKPLPTPNYRIRLLYNASGLTAKVQSTIVSSLHGGNIERHIMRKANWTRTVFNKIHWDAHRRAFKRLPRYSQHSTAKLIQGLINTN
jgi:ribonuclease HI